MQWGGHVDTNPSGIRIKRQIERRLAEVMRVAILRQRAEVLDRDKDLTGARWNLKFLIRIGLRPRN